jgi:hypothetical protein
MQLQTNSFNPPPQKCDADENFEKQRRLLQFLKTGESFQSEEVMRSWLEEKGVDLNCADSGKGIHKLFQKVQLGEATLIYDEVEHRVYRCATASRIATEITFHGERYPLFELCQIFLKDAIDRKCLEVTDPKEVMQVLSSLRIRSAHVRDSLEIWETFIGDEDPLLATRRGVKEELGLSLEDADKVEISMLRSGIEYEAPLDWPGIHSILRIFDAYAILPEEISKPVFVELEKGDQLTIFVATPNSDVLKGIMRMIIPKMNFTEK